MYFFINMKKNTQNNTSCIITVSFEISYHCYSLKCFLLTAWNQSLTHIFENSKRWKSKQWFIQSAFIQWTFLRWNDCLMSKESWMIYSMFTDQQHESFGSQGLTNWSLTTNKCYCLCSLHSTTAIAWRHIYTCRPRKITLAALFHSTVTLVDIFDRDRNYCKEQKF